MIKNNQGFSLLELAMVLFILSLMLSSFLSPLATSLEQRDREKNLALLNNIRESLTGFALVNGHLPCPDCPTSATSANCASAALTVNDGIEDGVVAGVGTSPRAGNIFTSCATTEGNLPWVTLDVPENDAWGHHFIYRVTETFADDTNGTASCTSPAAGVSFCLASANDADININDAAGTSVATGVPVIVVSTGNSKVNFAQLTASDIAALSAAENENIDNDTTFVYDDYNSETGTEFDDMVMWITPSILMYQMVKAEKLP